MQNTIQYNTLSDATENAKIVANLRIVKESSSNDVIYVIMMNNGNFRLNAKSLLNDDEIIMRRIPIIK